MHQTVNLNFYNVFCVPVKGTCKYGLIRSMDCLLKNKKLLTHDGRLVESNVVLKSKNLVLYYFSAAWCEKCSWVLTILQKIYEVFINYIHYYLLHINF